MAKEDIEIYSKSIADVKASMDEYRRVLDTVSKDSKEYLETLEKLNKAQREFVSLFKQQTTATNAQAKAQKKVTEEVQASDNSMKAMKDRLKELKKEANTLDVASDRFKQLSKQIYDTNEQLKNLEAKQGQFGRNVGNYANSFSEAMGKMGVSLGGAEKAFEGLSSAGVGFRGVLNTLKSHPFIAVVTALVAIFLKLKDAITNNAELSKRWSKTMSSFEPIVNAVQRALGYLAEKLVSVVEYVMGSLPKVLKSVGSGAKTVTNIVGTIIDSILFIPKTLAKVNQQIFKLLSEGVKKVAGGLSGLLKSVGLDSLADGLTKGVNAYVSVMNKGFEVVIKGAENAGNAVRALGNGIDNITNRLATSMTLATKRAEDAQKLQKDIREQERLSAESELKQAELRERIATTTGQERLKAMKALHQEIERNGKREVDLARRQYEQIKLINSLAPTSKEAKAREREAFNAIARAEATYTNAMASVDKKFTALQGKMTKAQESAMAKREAERAKAQAKAEKAMNEYYSTFKQTISNIQKESSDDVNLLNSNKQLIEQQGQVSLEQAMNFEKQRYDIVKNGIDKQIEEYKKVLDSDKLTDKARLEANRNYQSLLIQSQIESNNNYLNNLKIRNEQETNELKKQKQKIQDIQSNKDIENIETYALDVTVLNAQYEKGEITYRQYLKALENAQKEHELQSHQIQIEELQQQEQLQLQHWLNIIEINGENSDIALEAERQYQEARTKLMQEESKKQIEILKKQADDEALTEEKRNKRNKAIANASKSLATAITNVWQASIEERLDAGKISQEQAEEEFENVKKIQIAMAIVDTLQSAVSAYQSAMQSFPAPYNAVIGATMAATALATGYQRVNEIRNTEIGGSTSSSSIASQSITVASATPTLNETQDLSNLVTPTYSLNDENRDQRVYILQSDISDSERQVKTRIEQSTF